VFENANSSILTNFDFDSNVTEKSVLLEEKLDLPSDSTDDGRITFINLLQRKGDASIRINFDIDSDVTDESDLHSEKQPR
jgi:hypothetical protein